MGGGAEDGEGQNQSEGKEHDEAESKRIWQHIDYLGKASKKWYFLRIFPN